MTMNDPLSPQQEVRMSLPKIFVPPCYTTQPSILSHWRYESRREAQQLLHFLWLGPIGSLRDESFLADNNIRNLISLSNMRCRLKNSTQYEYHEFDTGEDCNTGAKLVNHFAQINALIDRALANDVSTIIFCDSGNELSATVAAAYIMHHNNVGYIEAIQYVQSKRFSIALNDVSKYSLQTYADILQAQQSAPQDGSSTMTENKRLLDDSQEDAFGGSIQKRRFDDE